MAKRPSDMTEEKDYKDTVFLPKTDFPMKAGLANKEPAILERWEAMGLYERLREQRAGKENSSCMMARLMQTAISISAIASTRRSKILWCAAKACSVKMRPMCPAGIVTAADRMENRRAISQEKA